MNQTPQFNVEHAIRDLLTTIIGLNIYTSNRTGLRLFPFVTISASVNEQMLGNYTGVYDISVAVNYSDTAAKITQEDFDSEYCAIFESFYSETPTLAAKIQNKIIDTTIHMARISSQSPSIRANKRAWQRGLTLSIICAPYEAPIPPVGGNRYLDFSNYRNSMYVSVI
jgi:hypothetical protein